MTPAIERAARAMWFEDCGVAAQGNDAEPFEDYARAALDAALDVEELARVIDAEAFCTPWHQAHDPRDRRQGEVRQANALAIARAIRAHILGQTDPDRTGISDTTTRSDSEGSKA